MAQRIARGKLRKSSLKVYDVRWKSFSKWCEEHHIQAWKVTIPQIAEFFLYLFTEKNLSPRTVEGYRSAIASTLSKVLDLDIGSDPNLSSLIASFYTDRPIGNRSLPEWDLNLVLSTLRKPPFENPEHPELVKLKFWTWKTCFLLMLASGARRSEIHALDPDRIQWSEDRTSVTLRPKLGFMAKNHVARDPSTAFRGFTIKALGTARSARVKLLCPVRALKWYLARTKNIRKKGSRLFLSLKSSSSTGVCANTISSWMRQTILEAYKQAEAEAANCLKLERARGHAIRAFKATWQAFRHISIQEILTSCRWKSANTFANFYLKDMVVLENGLRAFAEFSEALA